MIPCRRFEFEPRPKPWWWLFTLFRKKWKHYGIFVEIKQNDPRFADARYEEIVIYHPEGTSLDDLPNRFPPDISL